MRSIEHFEGKLRPRRPYPEKQVLEDVPKRLEIAYKYGFEAADLRKATIDGIRNNVDAATFAELAEPIAAMNALYRDVEPGQRYAITYVPGVGTELALDGEVLGVVPGAAFGSAVFGIWLGPKPFDDALRDTLLGTS